MYCIRQVQSIDELKSMWEVVVAPFRHKMKYEERHLADHVDWFPTSRELMLVVEQDGEIIGGVLGHDGSLCELTLEAEHRGKGLGRRLLQTFEVASLRRGVRMIILGSDPENKAFFEKTGYHGRKMSMSKEFPVGGRVFERRLSRLVEQVGDLEEGTVVEADADGNIAALRAAY